jgi:hypothetical protein
MSPAKPRSKASRKKVKKVVAKASAKRAKWVPSSAAAPTPLDDADIEAGLEDLFAEGSGEEDAGADSDAAESSEEEAPDEEEAAAVAAPVSAGMTNCLVNPDVARHIMLICGARGGNSQDSGGRVVHSHTLRLLRNSLTSERAV